ncbi:haloacid dehalogenase-like hydrolase [Ornithobacterium rhinotracheale]|uniref:haloacid dehalogenase-like hydrolase n=1 Tax=Ornithobacterium rhinotracheale TaxID=28251 RepID=UPI0002D5C23A|nr:haloacid dehalogenase-like hydrolase [Ornithobacterium rhinotracheale]
MRRKKYTTIAIAYDFDGTLAPGNMQERSFLPSLEIDKSDFWKENKKLAEENDMSEILSYMFLMLKKRLRKMLKSPKTHLLSMEKILNILKG